MPPRPSSRSTRKRPIKRVLSATDGGTAVRLRCRTAAIQDPHPRTPDLPRQLERCPGDIVAVARLDEAVRAVDPMDQVIPAGVKAGYVDELTIQVGRVGIAVADRDPLSDTEEALLTPTAVAGEVLLPRGL